MPDLIVIDEAVPDTIESIPQQLITAVNIKRGDVVILGSDHPLLINRMRSRLASLNCRARVVTLTSLVGSADDSQLNDDDEISPTPVWGHYGSVFNDR